MSNKITIELCAEDRARLDRLAEALEMKITAVEKSEPVKQEETKEEVTSLPAAEPTRKVDRAELRAKVIELSAKGLKVQARDIVQAYAPTVASVPEEQIAECFEKLVALEG